MKTVAQLVGRYRSYIDLIMLGVIICLAGNYLFFRTGLMDFFPAYQKGLNELYARSLVEQVILVGMISPVLEELLFRRLIFKRVRIHANFSLSCLVSAVIFGCYHGNLVQGIFGFLTGCLLAYFYERFGHLAAPIILHSSINLSSVMFIHFQLKPESIKWILGFLVLLFCLKKIGKQINRIA